MAMACPSGAATEALLDITIPPLLSPEPELQRGRKRRRDSLAVSAGRTTIPSGESATFRGRCRCRSVSRYLNMSSLSRPTSQHRMLAGAHHHNTTTSPSPSHRHDMMLVAQLAVDRPRSQSPSRSRSPNTVHAAQEPMQYVAKRRRQRTKSRSRIHMSLPVNIGAIPHGDGGRVKAVEAVVTMAVPDAVSTAKENDEQS